jgi:pyrrolidone-carboxylate peptidase
MSTPSHAEQANVVYEDIPVNTDSPRSYFSKQIFEYVTNIVWELGIIAYIIKPMGYKVTNHLFMHSSIHQNKSMRQPEHMNNLHIQQCAIMTVIMQVNV